GGPAVDLPVRVSNAANRFKAPHRPYSCSTRTGRPGCAARVGDLRGRGCKLVFSSTHRTISVGLSGRVYRSLISRTAAANAASLGTSGESQRCCRQGLRWWCSRIRRTVSGEMAGTTPSATNWRAISRQSQSASDRPRSSGRSQAILTRCRATSGGKDRLAAGSGPGAGAGQAEGPEAVGPLADVPRAPPAARGGVLQGQGAFGEQG